MGGCGVLIRHPRGGNDPNVAQATRSAGMARRQPLPFCPGFPPVCVVRPGRP